MKWLYRAFVVGTLCFGWMSCASPPISTENPAVEQSFEWITERSSEVSSEPLQETSSGVETLEETANESLPEPSPEAGSEAQPEAEPEISPEPSPQRCQKDEACNALLTSEGFCPGDCIPQKTSAQCGGTVVHGLCTHTFTPRNNTTRVIDGLEFKPGPVPALMKEGETKSFTIEVTNTTSQTKQLALSYEVGSSWKLLQASFEGKVALDFKANEKKTLSLTVTAVQADVLTNPRSVGSIITFALFRDAFSLVGAVGYADGNDREACGSHFFPKTHCPDSPCNKSRRHYYQARCCQGVWFPGAACCVDSDCTNNGGCVDGQCVRLESRGLANSLATGHQRFLIVLSDRLDIPSDPSKVCTNRVKAFRKELKLDEFETYFNTLSQAYLKKPAPKFEYVVLAGINTSDFNKDGNRDLRSTHAALEAYLVKKSCIQSANDFDKRMIITGNIDIGPFTGRADTEGRMGMKRIDMYLFTHELIHTYGARDLYLDLGGTFQYLNDLMGNNLGARGVPELGVAWGEILWGDLNRNGVIDQFEYAVYPDSLIATDLKAQISSKGGLEVRASVLGIEKGVSKKLDVRRITIELPEYKTDVKVIPGSTVVFTPPQVDLDAIQQKGSVQVRVVASYTYTDSNFKRVERKLSSENDVMLTP